MNLKITLGCVWLMNLMLCFGAVTQMDYNLNAADALNKEGRILAWDQDELRADVQQLMMEEADPVVFEMLKGVEELMNVANQKLTKGELNEEVISIQTEVIEMIYESMLKKNRKQSSTPQNGKGDSASGKGESEGAKGGEKNGSGGGITSSESGSGNSRPDHESAPNPGGAEKDPNHRSDDASQSEKNGAGDERFTQDVAEVKGAETIADHAGGSTVIKPLQAGSIRKVPKTEGAQIQEIPIELREVFDGFHQEIQHQSPNKP